MEPAMYALWIWPLASSVVALEGNNGLTKKLWLSVPIASLLVSQLLVPRQGTFLMTFGFRHSVGFSFYNFHAAALEGLALSHMADTLLARIQCSAETRLASLFALFYSTFIYRHMTRLPHSGHIGVFFGLYFEMLVTY